MIYLETCYTCSNFPVFVCFWSWSKASVFNEKKELDLKCNCKFSSRINIK